MSTMLLSDASASLSSTKSLIIPECFIAFFCNIHPLQGSIRLKLKLFETGYRFPDFANVAHTLIKSLSDSNVLL